MTPGEQDRLAALEVSSKALEVRTEFYDRILDRMDRSLEQNGQALQSLVRLEERHQSLDRAAAATANNLSAEIQARQKVEEGIFERLRSLEGDGGLSSHFRINAERVILIVGGGLIATAVLWALQNSGA